MGIDSNLIFVPSPFHCVTGGASDNTAVGIMLNIRKKTVTKIEINIFFINLF
jgi:hypothetical protein